MDFGYIDYIFLFHFDFICSVFFSRPVVGMLFGAVLWYCSLVPFQTFSQQEAYEGLSRYKNLFFYHLDQYQYQYHHQHIKHYLSQFCHHYHCHHKHHHHHCYINMIIIMSGHCHCHHHHLYLIYQLLHKMQIKAFLSSLMGLQYVCFSFSR